MAGVVYAPVLYERYTARIGKPAWCNGKPITVSETRRLEQAVVICRRSCKATLLVAEELAFH